MESRNQRQVDRDKMSALGLHFKLWVWPCKQRYSGNTDGKFRAGEYDINIKYNAFDEKHTDVGNLISIT
jgi:HAE1 family hydrophobic/amphiphilic exporter-1